MKPFRRNQTHSIEDKIFNARLSHARKIIECAFGVLTRKFNIFQHQLNFKLKNTEIIIMACVCLHNYIISRNLELSDDQINFYKDNLQFHSFNDSISSSESESDGSDSEEDNLNQEEEDAEANNTRNLLKNYFISRAGYTKWQWNKI